mmetsp:Transcript_90696/g.236424  ORF Transcript_90696/g.236424 Transcript_90696/m.236424 type:complete len:220 (-) Transcript_90696:138-797(-)
MEVVVCADEDARPHTAEQQPEGEENPISLLVVPVRLYSAVCLFGGLVFGPAFHNNRLDLIHDVLYNLVSEHSEDHLIQVQNKGQGRHVHDDILDASGLHQETHATACSDPPNVELRNDDQDKTHDLPNQGHAVQLKFHEIKLAATQHLLDGLPVGPLRDVVLQPDARGTREVVDHGEHPRGVVQVGHHADHKDEDTNQTAPVVLDTVLTGVHRAPDFVG